MNKVAIVGAGGFAREALWLIREMKKSGAEIEPWGFIDDNPKLHGKSICDLEVKGNLSALASKKDEVSALCAIGNPRSKKKVVSKALEIGIRFTSVIAPDVKASDYLEIGSGVIICAGNILTTQIRVGNHVIVNLDCTVGHDVVIGDYATIAPGVHISGNCSIGEGVDIGTGANLIQGITIGAGSVIGAGAAVVGDIPPGVTAVGVPARVIKEHG